MVAVGLLAALTVCLAAVAAVLVWDPVLGPPCALTQHPLGHAAPLNTAGRMPAPRFYAPYHGHHPDDLRAAWRALRAASPNKFVFLVGDSTLDNKHWLRNAGDAPPPPPWDAVFTGAAPRVPRDVAYWMNADGGAAGWTTVNAAVEASTLRARATHLLPQDAVVRECVRSGDALVVSVGGNDVLLHPSLGGALNLGAALLLPNTHLGTPYFVRLFHDGVEDWVVRMLGGDGRPRLSTIVVCLPYFPDASRASTSWAWLGLNLLKYDEDPARLQAVMRKIAAATAAHGFPRLRALADRVLVVPMFHVLDGRSSEHYVSRVEPSVDGGRALAQHFLAHLGSSPTKK